MEFFVCTYISTSSVCLIPREEVEEGARSPGTELIDHYKWSCGYWDLNLNLEEKANAIFQGPKAFIFKSYSHSRPELQNHRSQLLISSCGSRLCRWSHPHHLLSQQLASTVMSSLIFWLHQRKHKSQEDTDFLVM